MARSASVETWGERRSAASSSSTSVAPAPARVASSAALADAPRAAARARAALHAEALHQTPISAVRTPGQIATEPPPPRRRAEPAAKPATPLGPGRPRPLDHALVDGQDAPPRAAPVGEHDRLVDVRAA